MNKKAVTDYVLLLVIIIVIALVLVFFYLIVFDHQFFPNIPPIFGSSS